MEADLLHHYGVDLVDVWRGRLSVRKALNLIDRLPRATHYRHELAHDEDLARLMADRFDGVSAGSSDVPLTEWTPEAELLTYVCERIGGLASIMSAAFGDGKVRSLPPMPRPSRALDRFLAERADEALDHVMAMVERARGD